MLLTRKTRQTTPGQPKPPLTQLKELPSEQRASVMAILRANTYEQARPLIEQLVGFAASVDTLGRFFAWQGLLEAMETSSEMIEQAGDFLSERHPDWTEENMRESACAFFTLQSVAQRDHRAFACIAQLGLKSSRDRLLAERLKFDKARTARKLALTRRRVRLEQLRFEESLRRKLDAGVEAVAKAFKNNPEAMELFQEASKKIGYTP
jgi:hypothetical protein